MDPILRIVRPRHIRSPATCTPSDRPVRGSFFRPIRSTQTTVLMVIGNTQASLAPLGLTLLDA